MGGGVVDRADLCQGAIRTRTLLGVQTELAVLVLVLALGPVAAFWNWGLLPPLVPLWLLLRHQTKKDPRFVQVWLDHLWLSHHYEA